MGFKKGDRGAQVRALQERLIALSYLLPRYGADGDLGEETLSAVGNFELEHRLPASPAWTVSDATLEVIKTAPTWARGIDVAKYQGEVDWKAVKASGITFAIAKATESKGYVDPCFKRNWAGMKAAGIVRGAYLFWHPDQDPFEQAQHFARTVGPLEPGDLVPTVDVERNDRLPSREVSARLVSLLVAIGALYNLKPIIYTSARVCEEQGITVGGECPVWLARYYARKGFRREGPPLPSQWKDWAMWQTGFGPGIPGVTGDVDRDFFRGTIEELRALTVGGAEKAA